MHYVDICAIIFYNIFFSYYDIISFICFYYYYISINIYAKFLSKPSIFKALNFGLYITLENLMVTPVWHAEHARSVSVISDDLANRHQVWTVLIISFYNEDL